MTNEIMGGRFQDGFLSGLAGAAATYVGPLKDIMAGTGDGDFGRVLGRTAIAGVVGGTTAAIGGGKFANGAVTGAFQHLTNGEARGAIARKSLEARYDKAVAKIQGQIDRGDQVIKIDTKDLRAIMAHDLSVAESLSQEIKNMSFSEYRNFIGGPGGDGTFAN